MSARVATRLVARGSQSGSEPFFSVKRELEHRSARSETPISRAALRARSVEVPVRAHDRTSGWRASVVPIKAVQHRIRKIILPEGFDLEHGSLLRGTSRYCRAVKVPVRINGEDSVRPLAVAGCSKTMHYELPGPVLGNYEDGASVKLTALRSCAIQVAELVPDHTCSGPFPIGDSDIGTKTIDHTIIPGVVDREHGALVLGATLVCRAKEVPRRIEEQTSERIVAVADYGVKVMQHSQHSGGAEFEYGAILPMFAAVLGCTVQVPRPVEDQAGNGILP